MRSILILLSILIIASCSLSTNQKSDEITPLIPLAVGNMWIFDINNGSKTDIDTLKVISDTLIGENIWYKLGSEHPILKTTFKGYYSNFDEGLFLLNENEKDKILLFKMVYQKGDKQVTTTNKWKWITTYVGEEIHKELNVMTYSYITEYEYVRYISGGETRTLYFNEPHNFNRILSPDLGFIKWESGYFRSLDDSTLTLSSKIEIKQKEFIESR